MKKSTIMGLALALSTPLLISSSALAQWTTSGTDVYTSSTAYDVAIGNTSPAAKLDVESSSTADPQIRIHQTSNTQWARLRFDGNGNLFTLSVGSPGTSTSNNVFHVYSHTANANILNVTSNSKVGINTIPASGSSYAFEVAGSAFASGTWTSSDLRWKRNIRTIDNALNRVLGLRGVTYEFRRDEYPQNNFPEGTQVGFIAQEVEKVLPEVVNTNSDGYKALAYQNVTALLVEATKEQQELIARQQSAIDLLSARVAELEVLVKRNAQSSGVGSPAGADLLSRVTLDQNEPNPADGSAKISFYLPAGLGGAELVVNEAASGREVYRTPLAGTGAGSVLVGSERLSAGSYVYSIVVDGAVAASRRMIVAR